MKYAFQVRAQTKDDAKSAISTEFDEITSTSAPTDWSAPQAAADALIDALEDNASLDIVLTISGDVMFLGDVCRHVTFAFSGLLTDREAHRA